MIAIGGRQRWTPAGQARRCVGRCSRMPPGCPRSARRQMQAARSSAHGRRWIKHGGDRPCWPRSRWPLSPDSWLRLGFLLFARPPWRQRPPL